MFLSNNYSKLILFVLIFISEISLFNIYSQEKLEYAIPKELKFKKLEKSYNSNKNIQVTRFYPLGWSKDSKFAYITFHEETDACGCIFSDLVIHNLVNDKVEYISISNELDENIPGEVPFERIWQDKYNPVFETLRNYKIVPINQTQIGSIPIIHKGDTLTFKVDTLIVDKGKKYVEKLTLSVHSPMLVTKTIFKGNLYGVYQIDILGYLSSPHENRIAVIIAERCYGIEGSSPSFIRFRLVGCHLTKGFK